MSFSFAQIWWNFIFFIQKNISFEPISRFLTQFEKMQQITENIISSECLNIQCSLYNGKDDGGVLFCPSGTYESLCQSHEYSWDEMLMKMMTMMLMVGISDSDVIEPVYHFHKNLHSLYLFVFLCVCVHFLLIFILSTHSTAINSCAPNVCNDVRFELKFSKVVLVIQLTGI